METWSSNAIARFIQHLQHLYIYELGLATSLTYSGTSPNLTAAPPTLPGRPKVGGSPARGYIYTHYTHRGIRLKFKY